MKRRMELDDEEKPQPPQLMGGDGTAGAGVVVCETRAGATMFVKLEHRSTVEDDETVTLQLQHPSTDSDDNPILCSVVCNRRAIRASSSLIRNLLDNMGRDDEVLPPFSTEHIADELTLRRVVEFAGLETALPPRFLDGDDFLYTDKDGETCVKELKVVQLGRDVRDLFHKWVAEDGHRGGILNALIAAHYLCCEKLKNAAAAYLAMVISARIDAESNASPVGIFSPELDDNSPPDGDPLAHVSLAVLSEISNLMINDIADDTVWLICLYSSALLDSVALVDRLWTKKRCLALSELAEPNLARCQACQAVEQRLLHYPERPTYFLYKIGVSVFDERWRTIVEVGALELAKDESLWTAGNEFNCYESCLLSDKHLANFSNSESIMMAILAARVKVNPGGMVHVPGVRFLPIAPCWKEFHQYVTGKAPSLSVELHDLEFILKKATSLRTLHLWRDPNESENRIDDKGVPKLFDVAMIETVAMEHYSSNILAALPSCLVRLSIRKMNSVSALEEVIKAVFHHCQFPELEELMLGDARDANVLHNIYDVLSDERMVTWQQDDRVRHKRIRMYFLCECPRSLRDYDRIAEFEGMIEFFAIRMGECKSFPSTPEEGCVERFASWPEVQMPQLVYCCH